MQNSSNLAYRLDYDDPVIQDAKIKAYRKKKNQRMHKIKYIRRIVCILMIASAAMFMISKYVSVNETRSEIDSLRSQVEELQATNSQMMFELEQSVDLAAIEKEATQRLGMQRPEKYQTIYVDIQQEDKTETTSQSVESAQSRIGKFFSSLKQNIIDMFSIK